MAQDEKNTASKKKSGSSGAKEKKSKEKPPSKVIIRRLPPTMTEEVFREQISPLPDNDFFYYIKGEQHAVGVPTFSRAYINFVNQEEIFTFQDKFDGYVFLDQKGNEFTALVEFAPYQKIPRPGDSVKEDKCNTIDNDPHYLEFLKKLENPEEIVLQSAESYLEQLELKEREIKANGHIKVNTPLVEFIVQRRLDREKYREEKKEERRRKDMEKKKQRDMERNKKRDGKNKDDKKNDKPSSKGKKDEDRASNPIRVLKNSERQPPEKVEVAEGGAVTKRPRDTLKPKEKANKDKPPRENRSKGAKGPIEPKRPNEGADKVEVKDTEAGSSQATKKATVHKDESPKGERNIVEPVQKSEEERATTGKKRNEKETDRERKIRNKDRPAIQIYRPGAKRLTNQPAEEAGSPVTPPPPTGIKRDVKTRTFSRTSAKE
nr:EOG090X04G9 [Eurycercus lamellatus]